VESILESSVFLICLAEWLSRLSWMMASGFFLISDDRCDGRPVDGQYDLNLFFARKFIMEYGLRTCSFPRQLYPSYNSRIFPPDRQRLRSAEVRLWL
jgi:hypothetical protein